MKKLSILLVSILLLGCEKPTTETTSSLDTIIPQPLTIEKENGTFNFYSSVRILCDTDFSNIQTLLTSELSKNEDIQISEKSTRKIVISKIKGENSLGEEGYILDIKPNTITISGNSYGGVFYGVQTLLQLISLDSTAKIPCGKITDKPKYAWRGFMLDVARYFHPKEDIIKFIDLLSFYKINKFQLHLTDDQGWRLEIESLPKLTQVGSVHPSKDSLQGGFYTKADMREIIEYARLRNISIIPEIDLPGHSQAAIASYPELSCFSEKVTVRPHHVKFTNPLDGTPFSNPICIGKKVSYEFLEKVIAEVADLFPSEFIHLGGDECSTGAWKTCQFCQKTKEKNGLKDEDALRGYFMKRMEKIVQTHGKKAIGWDEVYETDVPKTFHVMAWREEIWGIDAANDDYQVILAPSQYYYYNRRIQEENKERYYGVTTTLPFMYGYRPSFDKIKPEFQKNILGLQSCVWGNNGWDNAMYNMFPRFLVFSEHSWATKESGLNDFVQRLNHQYKVLDEKNIGYYVAHPSGLHDDISYTDDYKLDLTVPITPSEIRYTLDGSEPTIESELYTTSFNVPIGTVTKAKTFLPNGLSSITVEGTSRKENLLPSINVNSLKSGLHLTLGKGILTTTEDFEKLTITYTGIVDKIAYPSDSLRHDFGLRFSGYIKIPKDGVYSFYSTSCDGSNLYIDDALFLSNDFKHPKLSFTKRIALAKGFHKIKLDYFYNSIFEKFFMLEMSSSDLVRQEVPSGFLFH